MICRLSGARPIPDMRITCQLFFFQENTVVASNDKWVTESNHRGGIICNVHITWLLVVIKSIQTLRNPISNWSKPRVLMNFLNLLYKIHRVITASHCINPIAYCINSLDAHNTDTYYTRISSLTILIRNSVGVWLLPHRPCRSFYKHRLIPIRARMSNDIHCLMWDVIT